MALNPIMAAQLAMLAAQNPDAAGLQMAQLTGGQPPGSLGQLAAPPAAKPSLPPQFAPPISGARPPLPPGFAPPVPGVKPPANPFDMLGGQVPGPALQPAGVPQAILQQADTTPAPQTPQPAVQPPQQGNPLELFAALQALSQPQLSNLQAPAPPAARPAINPLNLMQLLQSTGAGGGVGQVPSLGALIRGF